MLLEEILKKIPDITKAGENSAKNTSGLGAAADMGLIFAGLFVIFGTIIVGTSIIGTSIKSTYFTVKERHQGYRYPKEIKYLEDVNQLELPFPIPNLSFTQHFCKNFVKYLGYPWSEL